MSAVTGSAEPRPRPLEPSEQELRELIDTATDFVCRSLRELDQQPVFTLAGVGAVLADPEIRRPPAETGRSLADLLAVIERAGSVGHRNPSGGHFAYIPGSGLVSAAVAELVADVLNRYGGIGEAAPGLVAIEADLIRWLADVFGLPDGAGGILTTGGSMGALSALVAMRADRLGDDFADGVIYVSDQAHASIAKAARIAGFPERAVRSVPTHRGGRLDPAAVRAAVTGDRRTGRRPAGLVATAGTTNLGVVDPLPELADVAAAEGLWLHVDAAYGGFFQLTERGRARFAGIERADSIVLDAHKGLFLPFGTACLLVRSVGALRAGHTGGSAHYLQELQAVGVPDFADLSIELTREVRGLRMWLPLQLHGVGAFRACLDEKLDLAARAHAALAADPRVQLWGPEPDLTVIGWRVAHDDPHEGDRLTAEVIHRVNEQGRVFLSSTVVDDRYVGRIAILNHRTDAARLDEAVAAISRHAASVSRDGPATTTGDPD